MKARIGIKHVAMLLLVAVASAAAVAGNKKIVGYMLDISRFRVPTMETVKRQVDILATNRKWQMAPSICIGGNGGICEQLRFVNNEVIDKRLGRAAQQRLGGTPRPTQKPETRN